MSGLTKPTFSICRQEHETLGEPWVSELSPLLQLATVADNLPRKLIWDFLSLLVLLEGWVSPSLCRELITSPPFQLMFIHSHFKAIHFFVSSAIENPLLYSLQCLQSVLVSPSCFYSLKPNYQFILIFPHPYNESKSLSF